MSSTGLGLISFFYDVSKRPLPERHSFIKQLGALVSNGLFRSNKTYESSHDMNEDLSRGRCDRDGGD